MECGGGILSSFLNTRRRREKLERSRRSEFFMENGSQLLEEFITSWNGRCSIPIRNFSAEELIRATNNFDSLNRVDQDAFYALYRGSFGERPILVKKYRSRFHGDTDRTARAVRDIAMTSQMSGHKNVVKLIGYCLEFKHPVLVYEDVGGTGLLSRSLYKRGEGDMGNHDGSLLSLKSRVSIANDIAYAFVYLHTAFSTPIIHRNLKSNQVIIDGCGVAKLLDFSLSIAIPPGKSQVEDMIVGTRCYAEPQYCLTGILTEKTDVYHFGMILVELLTGMRFANMNAQYGWFEEYVHTGWLNEIVDTRIRGEGGGVEHEQQLQAVVAVAMRCLEKEREDRPDMIDVAKELKRIQRLVQTTPSTQSSQ